MTEQIFGWMPESRQFVSGTAEEWTALGYYNKKERVINKSTSIVDKAIKEN